MRSGGRLLAALAVALAFAADAAAEGAPRHGLSAFGDLKYGGGFSHFDYADPTAPKGGTLRLWGLDSFDSLNPFILKGVPAEGLSLIFETLMVRAMDEPDAVYGLIAESAELPADRSWVAFTLRPEARWHDGTPITADDVVFSYRTLIDKGNPQFRILYRDVDRVEKLGPRKLRFTFKPGRHRDLALLMAQMPVVSQAYWRSLPFDATSMAPPLGSGPYRVGEVSAGRSITYRRVADYWGKDLAVNRGRYNFDALRWDYYRDRDIAFEAFFAGAYDFREEFTSRNWATQYDKPAVADGLVLRETIPDKTPSGVQAFFFNLRRAKFQDRRVREAFDLAFDFDWTNRNLFHGLYQRTNSMYQNSELAAEGTPGPAERAALEPLRAQVPPEVFGESFRAPAAEGIGGARDNLRRAAAALRDSGWRIRDGRLVDADGKRFAAEFLLFEASFQRIINPYIRNLERLGIDASIRIVDVANFKYRTDNFDYDIIVRRFVQPLTPGIEQRNYFGSQNANQPGSLNAGGIADPAVDALIERIVDADSRAGLVAATRALDRVLMWNRYVVPQWYKGSHNIAYWNMFARPQRPPDYDLGAIDTWWLDPAKAARLAARKPAP